MIVRLLSLYIAKRFVSMLALIFAAVAIVIFLADYVEVLRRFSDRPEFTSLAGIQLAAMRVPFLLDAAVPFVFLFASLISLLGLSRRLELVVARASGVSVWGFLRGAVRGRTALRVGGDRPAQPDRRQPEGGGRRQGGGAFRLGTRVARHLVSPGEPGGSLDRLRRLGAR